MAATRPRGVGPIVARSATSCRAIAAIVARRATRRRAISAVVARAAPVVARPCTRRRALHTHCRPFFLNSYTCRRVLQTRRWALRTRRREVRDPSSRPFPHPPCTHPHTPYKYACVLLFPRTLSEHPGLHLPR